MRGLALLVMSGAVWLLVAAVSVSADGGPHISAVNNGTGGLTADNCAGCHRAHTAPAADLLKVDASDLCLSCHNGDGATTDVVDGLQYVPSGGAAGLAGGHGSTVLGALRGGGFSYALIDSGGGSRKTYLSQTQALVFTGFSNGNTFTLTFTDNSTFYGAAGTTYTTAAITYAGNNSTTATNIQNALRALPIGYTTGITGLLSDQANFNASWSSTNSRFQVALQNNLTFVTAAEPLMTYATGGSGTIAISWPSDPALRELPRVGVLASTNKQPVTSKHLGPGTVWGNGTVEQGVGVALGGSDTLECTSCHNPHGSGTYRILRADPGEDWTAAGTPAFDNGSDVTVPDIAGVDPTTTVRNYTVLPATTASAAAAWTATQGDYVRRKVPAWNYTNLLADFDTSAWNQTLSGWAATSSAIANGPNVTTWCVACHTRYNGIATGTSPSSLVSPDPSDTHFTYRHGTQSAGCLMCHVSHGSNALMTSYHSANYTTPSGQPQFVYRLATSPGVFDGAVVFTQPSGSEGVDYRTEGDSRLLKVNNRGTCQLCHDPTETVTGGTIVGPVPSPLAP